MPSTWTLLRAAVQPVVAPYNLYTAYPLTEKELVATIATDTSRLRSFLRTRGYEPQYLSAAKRHPATRRLHDLSYRRVPDEHPPAVEGAALEAWPPSACQYHVHAFEMSERMAEGIFSVASHYELKPDLLPLDLERLEIHYGPRYGQEYLRGITDLTVPDTL